MSKRAEERALEFYPMKDYNKEPNYIHSCDSKMLDEVYREVFTLGYEQAEKDLGWHSVDESLPPVDEEVIVLTDIIAEDSIKIGLGRICFAHIVNPDLTVDIDGKPYKVVSHNGWNIPGVKYWMPMPELPEEE